MYIKKGEVEKANSEDTQTDGDLLNVWIPIRISFITKNYFQSKDICEYYQSEFGEFKRVA